MYQQLASNMSSYTLQVAPQSHDEHNLSVAETKVEVNILNSPSLILSVPGELELQDPAFIQYVTQEALSKFKEMVRWERHVSCTGRIIELDFTKNRPHPLSVISFCPATFDFFKN